MSTTYDTKYYKNSYFINSKTGCLLISEIRIVLPIIRIYIENI